MCARRCRVHDGRFMVVARATVFNVDGTASAARRLHDWAPDAPREHIRLRRRVSTDEDRAMSNTDAPRATRLAWRALPLTAAFGAMLVATSCCKREVKLSDADQRDVLVTASDLGPWLGGHKIDPAREKVDATYSFGSNEYEYEYETDELFVYSTLHMEQDIGEAGSAYRILGLGTAIGLADTGVERFPCDPSLKWGDESKCEVLKAEGVEVGAIIRVRSKQFAFLVAWAGLGVPTPSEASKVIDSHVAGFGRVPGLAKK